MAQRIKGQETRLILVTDGHKDGYEEELSDVLNFHVALNSDLLDQGYLSESTDRYDEVFKGAHFDFEMNHHSDDFTAFNQFIVDRARRQNGRTNGTINVSTVLEFDNGDVVTVLFPDAFFGTPDMSFAGRTEYGKTKYEGGCSEPQYVIN
jgi:hypothetical protein